MGYSAAIAQKVKEKINESRENAENLARLHTAEVHEKIPETEKIDLALSGVGIRIYEEALKGKDGLEERIKALRDENLGLQKKKKELLAAHGYPVDYCLPHYSCEKCRDTGFVDLAVCECYKKGMVAETYYSSGLGSLLKEQSFENFDLKLYSTKENADGTSPRKNMEYILKCAKDYAKNFTDEKSRNLLFLGGTGLGKTHISTSIAKRVIENGYSVVYDTAQNILHAFEKERFSNKDGADLTQKYFDCDLLIIDDLGTEFHTSFTMSELYNILNTRICAGKSMLISTNLEDMKAIGKAYDAKITSRLLGTFEAYRFIGEDIRLIRARAKAKKD